MKKLLPVLFAFLFFPCSLLWADDGQELFRDKCSLCHDHKVAEVHSADRKGWEDVVARMQKRAAGAISDADVAAIVEYLAKNFPQGN